MSCKRMHSILTIVLLVTAGTVSAGIASAGIASAAQTPRVPSGAKLVDVTITFPQTEPRKPVRRAITSPRAVAGLIRAADALKAPPPGNFVCPMFMILEPSLTVVFKAGRAGPALAQAQLPVSLGTAGSSGSSRCFPIHFSSRGREQSLLGNGFVRLVGRTIGVQLS